MRSRWTLVCCVLLVAGLSLGCGPAAESPAPEETASGDTASEADLTARAGAIHESVLTLDTHKDISPRLASQDFPEDPEARARFRERFDPTVDGSNQVDFPKMHEGGLDCAFFIVYVGQGERSPEGYARARDAAFAKFDAIHRMADVYSDEIGLATGPDEVERIAAEGKLVAAIGIENGYPMGEDLSLIEEFERRGAGYMSLTHNGHSQLGDSQDPRDEPADLQGGVSELGVQAIAELNRVGIMVDISHSAKATMLEAAELSRAPIIASHSAVAALTPHGRNLDDEQLRALRDNGGVIQVVAFSSYIKDLSERRAALEALREEMDIDMRAYFRRDELSDDERAELEARMEEYEGRVAEEIDPRYPDANVEDLVDHIDYAVELIGIDHVGISSDFDGGGGIEGWSDASETLNVTLELVRRGYTEEEIAQLWSGNLLRVWREAEEVAAGMQEGEGA